MKNAVSKVTGLVILVAALLLKLYGNPLYMISMEAPDKPQYWYTSRSIPLAIGDWQGKPFEFQSWVYHFIPKPNVVGVYYRDPLHPTRYVELSVVHTHMRHYLHDTNLCDYSQGIRQERVEIVTIPNSSVRAAFSKLTVLKTGQEYYQLSWYQWSSHSSQPTFWTWLPDALTWRIFHPTVPTWHFFNLVYLDSRDTLSEEASRDGLLRFASRLQQAINSPSPKK